jgi:hypothetical protein
VFYSGFQGEARLRGLACAVGVNSRSGLTEIDVLASPCAPSPVAVIRTTRLPLLPVWEKEVGEMRGKRAQTPPSPRVGEGSWGDEGQTRTEMAMRTARDTLVTASEPRHPQQRLPEVLVECAVGCFRRDPHIPATVGVLQRGGQRRDDLPAQAGRG